jgi:hypothetical protein
MPGYDAAAPEVFTAVRDRSALTTSPALELAASELTIRESARNDFHDPA